MYSLTETRCVRHKVALPSHGEQSPVDHNLPLVGEASGQHSLRASKLAVPQQHPRELCLTASCHTTLVDQRNLSFSSRPCLQWGLFIPALVETEGSGCGLNMSRHPRGKNVLET